MSEQRKWWESSVDAGKISMRLRGSLIALVPVIVFVAQMAGIDLPEEGVLAIVDAIVNAVASVALLYGIILSVYGYFRRKQ